MCAYERKRADPNYHEKKKRWESAKHERHRAARAEGRDTAKFIYADTRNNDRRKGRDNDLTIECVEVLIKDGCTYCGDTEIRMTLDRIDNERGHTQDNVVGACIRCNLTRGAMPHEAWKVLAPGMREARERGLFGAWTRALTSSASGPRTGQATRPHVEPEAKTANTRSPRGSSSAR